MAKKGGDWKYMVYFDPEADKSTGPDYKITDDELISKMNSLVDADEEILKIHAYKVPLTDVQITMMLLCHQFIVFETEHWWWSIEKNSEGITIQRSKQLSAVKEMYRREKRPTSVFHGIKLMKDDNGRYSVKDLIEWLYKEDELNKRYHFLFKNCKDFAKAVFDHIARSKFL